MPFYTPELLPANPTAQQLTFSSYKNHNTLKALVVITPTGEICFASDVVTVSWQTGFLIEDALVPGVEINVEINVPPLLNETGQLTENERTYTRQIASLRTHLLNR